MYQNQNIIIWFDSQNGWLYLLIPYLTLSVALVME